jgi:broad specificity phosphatase PhoE
MSIILYFLRHGQTEFSRDDSFCGSGLDPELTAEGLEIMLCSLLGIDVGRFRFRFACPVSSLSVVEFTDEGPLLHTLADRSHLTEALKSATGT